MKMNGIKQFLSIENNGYRKEMQREARNKMGIEEYKADH